MDVSPIIDSLNDAQREAVCASADPLLVLAGAGSGKSRVLVHRVAWLVDVEGLKCRVVRPAFLDFAFEGHALFAKLAEKSIG